MAPRSTWSHWSSLNWLDQRVAALPSEALPASMPPFSTDDAVATLPRARFGPSTVTLTELVTLRPPASWMVTSSVYVPPAEKVAVVFLAALLPLLLNTGLAAPAGLPATLHV